MGFPVFYYDTPEYVKQWPDNLPDISGIAVASFVTFGGPEGNQHNAACSRLECLAQKTAKCIIVSCFAGSCK